MNKEFLVSYNYMDKMFRTRFATISVKYEEGKEFLGDQIISAVENHLQRTVAHDYQCFTIVSIWPIWEK
jgi:hypothetical protein